MNRRIRGFIATPSGARIPVLVSFQKSPSLPAYSHIGQIPIPNPWLEEFETDIRRFHFRGEDGECFTQIHVLDEYHDDVGTPIKVGRLILLQDHLPQ
ncbi:hypothetical protein N9M66_06440 [Litoreibacter sp.]|nr:hypothetical protein [Litoreibacter sp.]